jgi:hypothetical protein
VVTEVVGRWIPVPTSNYVSEPVSKDVGTGVVRMYNLRYDSAK